MRIASGAVVVASGVHDVSARQLSCGIASMSILDDMTALWPGHFGASCATMFTAVLTCLAVEGTWPATPSCVLAHAGATVKCT
jgi:hypothetical protein